MEASRYVEQKKQTQDLNPRHLFELRGRTEQRFDAYDQAKENLFAEVRRLYETQCRPPKPPQRIVAAAAALLPAVIVCKNLLDDLVFGARNERGPNSVV